MEDRIHTRVIFNVSASLDFNGHIVNGNVENLSMSGMLINTCDPIPEGAEAQASIYLSGATSELSLNMICKVIRKGKHCIAVQFTQMDIDSYIHLKNIVAFNKMDEEKIMKEFESSDLGESL